MLVSSSLGINMPFKVREFGGVRNQFTINFAGNRYFQSYDSIICMQDSKGKMYLDKTYWKYSRTTGKYRNKWLGEDIKETEKKIKSGKYILTDLNSSENE